MYLFTGICNFTKYLIAVPIRDKSAITVARVLVKYVYLQYGAVDILVSDNGGEFANEISQQLNEVLGIQGIRITAYRASSNGVCERVHRSIHSVFAKTIAANQKNWCEMVPYVSYAYNIATHSATTYSPFFLMFGREAKTNLNNLLEIPEDEGQATPESYAKDVTKKLAEAYDIVCEELNCKFDRAKQRYDARVKPVQFKVGQFVWYYCPRRRPGLNPKWMNRNTGPHLIVRQNNLVNYTLKFTPGGERMQVVHIDKLTPYRGEISAKWRKQQQLLLPQSMGEAETPTPDSSAVNESPDSLESTANGDTVISATAAESRTRARPENLLQATAEPQPAAADEPANQKRQQPERPRVKPARFRRVGRARPQPSAHAQSFVNKINGGKSKKIFFCENCNFVLRSESTTAINQVRVAYDSSMADTLSERYGSEGAQSFESKRENLPNTAKRPRACTSLSDKQCHANPVLTMNDGDCNKNVNSSATHTLCSHCMADSEHSSVCVHSMSRSQRQEEAHDSSPNQSPSRQRGKRSRPGHSPPTLHPPAPLVANPGRFDCDVCGARYDRYQSVYRHMTVQHRRAFHRRRPSEPLTEDELVARRHEIWLSRQPAHKRAAFRAAQQAAAQPDLGSQQEGEEGTQDSALSGWRGGAEASTGLAEAAAGGRLDAPASMGSTEAVSSRRTGADATPGSAEGGRVPFPRPRGRGWKEDAPVDSDSHPTSDLPCASPQSFTLTREMEDELLQLGPQFGYFIGDEREAESLEELLQPDEDRLSWNFSPLEELVDVVLPQFSASGAPSAPEVSPMRGTYSTSFPGVDAEVQVDGPSLYLPPPPRDDVGVQVGPEMREAAQQCETILPFPVGVTVDDVMAVVRGDATLTAEQVVFYFRDRGVSMGAWQAKAIEIAATAGMSMLQGFGRAVRELIAGDMFKPGQQQVLAMLEETLQRVNASRDLTVEQRAWAGFDGSGCVEAMTAEQQVAYRQWCGRRLEVADRMIRERVEAAARRREHWEEAFLREDAARVAREEAERLRREARGMGDAATGDSASGGVGPGPHHGGAGFVPPTARWFGRGSRPSGGRSAPGRAPSADGGHDAGTPGTPRPGDYVEISDSADED